MKKKEKLPVINQSIRSRTLIYFIVMALSMITLLWAVQEWFFSTQYNKLKQAEIVKIMDQVADSYTVLHPAYFAELHQTALDNNMVVYFFTYKSTSGSGCVQYTEKGNTYYRLEGEITNEYLLSSVVELNDIFKSQGLNTNDLPWSAAQETRFITMLGLNWSLQPEKRSVHSYDAGLKRLYYAAEAQEEVYGGKVTHNYFYVEAFLSESDVTMDLIRFEFILLTIIILLLSLVFSLFVSELISRPISKISKRAEGFAKGDYDVRFDRSNIREIDNLASTLNFATEEISKTEQLRRDFIANISHDLRTPLTMVRAYAEMIRDISGNSPEKRMAHAQVIIDEANRLSQLVEDIQRLSKIQAGTDSINTAPFDIDEFCESTVRQFAVMREKFGYDIIYESGGKNTVSADRDKISQVLYNLIGNAFNYTNKETKIVKIRQFKKGNVAVVEVEDNGKGIAEEDLDSVWDRYYRVNQEKRSVVGSGLGLSIVKNILVAHNAEFGIKSELNKGTIFWFSLPLVRGKKKNNKTLK